MGDLSIPKPKFDLFDKVNPFKYKGYGPFIVTCIDYDIVRKTWKYAGIDSGVFREDDLELVKKI